MKMDLDPQLRKVAILVASADEAWGEQFLAGLPPKQAMRVRNAIEDLDIIDPEEQQAILQEFRRTKQPPAAPDSNGVELDPALVARMEQDDFQPQTVPLHGGQQEPFALITEADTSFIVEMLAGEHPQTTAVVISRLENDRAAEVLSQLPTPLQAEVLARLTELDATDEQSLRVVEMQVAQWILQQRERKQRMTVGREIVTRLLGTKPQHQRQLILAQIARHNPAVAGELATGTSASQMESPSRSVAGVDTASPAAPMPTGPAVAPQYQRAEPKQFPAAHPPHVAHDNEQLSPKLDRTSAMSAAEVVAALEQLDYVTLQAAIANSPPQVVNLALAGASEKLLRSVVHSLPHRQAKQLRRSVQLAAPTRLSDILTAQRYLLNIAESAHSVP